MRGTGWRGLKHEPDGVGDRVVADPARRSGPWLVEQAVQAVRGKAAAPFAHRVGVGTHVDADGLVLQPCRGGQHDACPTRHGLPGLQRPCQ